MARLQLPTLPSLKRYVNKLHRLYFSFNKHTSTQSLSSLFSLPWTRWQWRWCYHSLNTLSLTHTHTRSQRYSSQWITGGWSGSRWRAVLPCDSPHTSTLLSRKLKWKCGPWKSVAPIYPWTRANDLSFLSGAQAAALALTLHTAPEGRAASPAYTVFTYVCFNPIFVVSF